MNAHAVRLFNSVLAVAVLSGLGQVAPAQQTDPPARVARLDYAQGAVSLQPAGITEWTAAVVNRPLTSGDRLWTDRSSRAELDIGSATLRLNENTAFAFLNLSDEAAQIQLTAGTLGVHVRGLDSHETVEVDTPNIAVSLLQPGDYRIVVNNAGDASIVAVREGEAEISGGGGTFSVHAQQTGTFAGINQLSSDVGFIGLPDDFDRWSMDRDAREAESQSAQYVSSDIIGYEDLDNNGQWDSDPDYGSVWVPTNVAPDWAPYRDGSWVWIAPWGWTWVDQASWGFAPFHYGRWVSGHRGWCWAPGPRVPRPVYAPALVAWVGGPHLSASIAVSGTPGVAWFPLGPREVYAPSYHASPRYVERVNVTNTAVSNSYVISIYYNHAVAIRYVNQRTPGAITAVSQNTFVSGQHVGRHARTDSGELAVARASTRDMTVIPDKESVLGGAQRPDIARPPALLHDRMVVTKATPPKAAISFDRTQQVLRANGGRPLAPADLDRLRPPEYLSPAGRLVPPVYTRPSTGRAQAPKFYQPAPTPSTPEPQVAQPVGTAPNVENLGSAPQDRSRPEPPLEIHQEVQHEVHEVPPHEVRQEPPPHEEHPAHRENSRPEREVPPPVQQR